MGAGERVAGVVPIECGTVAHGHGLGGGEVGDRAELGEGGLAGADAGGGFAEEGVVGPFPDWIGGAG